MSHSGPIQLLDGTTHWFADGEHVATTYPARMLDDGMPTFESFAAAVPLATEADYATFCDEWRDADEDKRGKIICHLADEAALNAEAKRIHEGALVSAGLAPDPDEPRGAFDDFADHLQELGEELLVEDEPDGGDVVTIGADEEPKQ